MKKIFIFIFLLFNLANFSFGNSLCSIKNHICNSNSEIKINESLDIDRLERFDNFKNSKKSKNSEANDNKKDDKKPCETCQVEDDEYSIYNQCYFNRHYRNMKMFLNLDNEKEIILDTIYKNFKQDMEAHLYNYQKEKNKLLEMIECDIKCYKNQIKVVKEMKKDTVLKYHDFIQSIKDELPRYQARKLNRFEIKERKKFNKIKKYGKIVKLPCINCTKNYE